MSESTRILSGNRYTVTHSVGGNQPGIRLDQFLRQRYRKRSREQLKRAITDGAIVILRESIGHQPLGSFKPSTTLMPGDRVQVTSIRSPEPPVNFNYSILYEDDAILAVSKPASLPVHPAGRFFFNTLLTHLQTSGFDPEQMQEKTFYLVHRIDKETSGVLLLAKTKEACAHLTKQFFDRQTEKTYLAIVHGAPAQTETDVSHPIGKMATSKIGLRMYALSLESGGLPSQTIFILKRTQQGAKGTFSLMECIPKTGRQHQIRIHAEIAGFPLVGDKLYGISIDDAIELLDANSDSVDENAEDQEFECLDLENMPPLKPATAKLRQLEHKLLMPRHALHAASLKFKHPTSNIDMTIEAPIPDDFVKFLESI